MEYTLDSCQEPHLFVICKQERQSADAAVPVMFYYILDGSVYQAPTIHGVLSARLVRACPVCRALVTFLCSCIIKVQSNKLLLKRLTLLYFALSCHTILAHRSLEGTAPASTSHLGFGKGSPD